jgi:hypothetical protein
VTCFVMKVALGAIRCLSNCHVLSAELKKGKQKETVKTRENAYLFLVLNKQN